MRKIDSCYFCTTPFQIITAISIMKQNGEKADLYILNSFDGAEKCASNIKKEKLFLEVKLIGQHSCPYKNKIMIWIWATLSYLRVRKIATDALIPNTVYNNMYSSGRNIIFKCMYFYMLSKNGSLKRINFDDGVGSYLNDRFISFRRSDRILQRLLFGEKALQPIEKQMLYCPELYFNIHGRPEREIDAIEGLFENKDMVEIFNRIFDYNESNNIEESIILIDCLRNEDFDENERNKLLSIYKIIFNTLGYDNIIVKQHPRDNAEKEQGVKYYPNKNVPFECICMNIDCNSKLLIAVSSTSVITPKLLMNQEPYVLLLYKLVNLKNTPNSDIENLYNSCQKLYSKPERFSIPDNNDELMVFLKKMENYKPL